MYKTFISGEVNMISDLPAYVKYWRNKFSQRLEDIAPNYIEKNDNKLLTPILAEYTTCLQMDVQQNESLLNTEGPRSSSDSKQDFYFLADVLPEDKVT